MEKNGLIKRENVSKDARLKKIVLTQKAMEIRKNVSKAIEDVEAVSYTHLVHYYQRIVFS